MVHKRRRRAQDIRALVRASSIYAALPSALLLLLLVPARSSERLVAEVLVQAEGCSVPQADDGGAADLVGPPEGHLDDLLEGPAAGYIVESAYLLPVACIVGFKLMLFRAAK